MRINGEYVKGSITHDTSFKDVKNGEIRRHNKYRAVVEYNDKKSRFRSASYEECVKFLLDLKEKHIIEYTKTCDWCGKPYELTGRNSNSRFCSPGCARIAAIKRREKTCGMSFIDEHGKKIKPPKKRHG